MSADLLSEGLKLWSQNRVAVFLLILSDFLSSKLFFGVEILDTGSLLELVAPQAYLLDGILAGVTIRSDQLVHSAVRPGSHDIVLDQNGLPFFSQNQGAGLVTVLEILALPSLSLLDITRAVDGLGLHCHESFETVAPVDVKHLSHRTQAVGGIQIAFAFLVEIKPPVIPVSVPERIQVM